LSKGFSDASAGNHRAILGRRGTNEFFNPHRALGQFGEECGEDFRVSKMRGCFAQQAQERERQDAHSLRHQRKRLA